MLGEEFFEVGLGEAEGGAGFGLEAAVEAVVVAWAVEFGQELADEAGKLFGAAEVEPALASLIAVRQLVVGAEAFAIVGAPGCGYGAPAGEDVDVGFDEVLDVLEAGGVLLVLANRIAFFRVGGPGRGDVGCVAFCWGLVFGVLGGLLVLANGIAFFRVEGARGR